MSAIPSTPIQAEANNGHTCGGLFFLNLSAGRILTANPDGSDLKTIVNEGRKLPDGLALDAAAWHIYWTNMGNPERNDGSIMRSDLDGRNMITIVPPGGTFPPKQFQWEKRSRKLYRSDQEGMRVMRANLRTRWRSRVRFQRGWHGRSATATDVSTRPSEGSHRRRDVRNRIFQSRRRGLYVHFRLASQSHSEESNTCKTTHS